MNSNRKPTRVLIVDDEPNVAMMLSAGLEKLGNKYIFETASSGDEALTKLQQHAYDLVITDYNMPNMSGLNLAQAIRQISPETQIVLMTAYGTDRLRQAADYMNLEGYLDKPFTIGEIRQVVERAVGQTGSASTDQDPYRSGERVLDQCIGAKLAQLQTNTEARCVLLISLSGYPVSVVGQTNSLDVANVSALVAANFVAAAELANLVGSPNSIFKSSYHEGNDYNIYAYDVDGELLLAVIFGTEGKPGVVWFYTKQIATELVPMLKNQNSSSTITDEDLTSAFEAEFDKLFGDEVWLEKEMNLTEKQRERPNQPTEPGQEEKGGAMSFEQAVAAGLVPPQIVRREQDH